MDRPYLLTQVSTGIFVGHQLIKHGFEVFASASYARAYLHIAS
jgi:hypothetical protein